MRYKVPSPREIRKSFQKPKYSFLEYHVHRRISPYFTWVFLHLTIVAELVALLTPVADLLTIYFISQGNFLVAAILTQVNIILDSSDGEMARFRKTIIKRSANKERFGGFTDSFVGMIFFPFIVFYVGLEFGNLITGLIGIGAFYLLVFSSAYAKVYFPESKSTKKLSKKVFGDRKFKWGFNSIIQK